MQNTPARGGLINTNVGGGGGGSGFGGGFGTLGQSLLAWPHNRYLHKMSSHCQVMICPSQTYRAPIL